MTEEDEIREFREKHHWPDVCGISSLFRFSKLDEEHPEYTSALFVEGKLYHALPIQFNDPFECKPHFNIPKGERKGIKKHLVKVMKERGVSRRNSRSTVASKLKEGKLLKEAIGDSIRKAYGEMRLASFTTSKENLLFWSHYADSHRGFCVEYDSTILPVLAAFRVSYQDEYPTVGYPRPQDERGLIPLLIKSKAWEYEDEYRSVLMPESPDQLPNDGESLLLRGSEIKNVYFGANMKEEHKRTITDFIVRGPFNPGLWQTNLSKTSFKLRFSRI